MQLFSPAFDRYVALPGDGDAAPVRVVAGFGRTLVCTTVRSPPSHGPAPDTLTPVVDDDNRPIGLLSPEAALTNELVSGLVVNVTSTPQEVAARLSTSPGDCVVPVLVADGGGRYLGVLTVRRLLHALSGGH